MNVTLKYARAMVAVLVAAGLLCSVSPASAEQSLTLTFQCGFPLIGNEPLKVKIDADIPKTVVVNTPVPGFVIDSTSTVSAGATRGLGAVFAKTLEGEALAFARITAPGYPNGLGVRVNSFLTKTGIPESGEFSVAARGTSPNLRFVQAGHAKVVVGNLVLTITPRLTDGLPSGLGTFEAECTQNPGQNNVLAEFDIVAKDTTPPSAYGLSGSSFIKAAKGTLRLSGGIKTTFDASGAFTGDLTLAKTKGNFKLLGFLPTTADVAFAQVGQTTGTLTGSSLASSTKLTIALPSVKLLGIEIGGGANCKTAKPAEVELTSDGFTRTEGGTLSGTYTLPPVQGCGTLNALISAMATGPGNTVTLRATPEPPA